MPYTARQLEFAEEVITNLSGTLVDVELDIDDVFHAFKQAKRTWIQYGQENTERGFYKLEVNRDTVTYNIPDSIISVSEVIKPSGNGISSQDPFVMQGYQNLFSYSSGGSSAFIIYDLALQLIENRRQYIVADPEFIFNRRSHTIRFLKAPTSDQVWALDCFHLPSDEALMDDLWIFRYTVAECKMILGRAYRKFGTLPSPVGTDQIDGNDLVNEGKEEKQRLEEEIGEFIHGDPIGLGVFIG